ncbi:AmpG family muropeptide MFS transporter [Catenovulum sediminis]|uniref:MFS transporter n=1 Tax=Catenovulum sediminis TaxID=1740262 RepID=A0ABV1RLU2_9ALTE
MVSTHSFKNTLSYFKDPRLLTVFFLGVASGFPWVLIGSAMSGWLKDDGLSRSSIGLFGLIFVAYSINFLWSPFVDRIRIAVLGRFFGQRRSWILTTQLCIVLLTYLVSHLNANQDLATMALFGLLIAIAGATQDIAIDAYRIDLLQNHDSNYMTAGSAMATSGWWTGYAGLGSIPFILVDRPEWNWPAVYLVLSIVMIALMITVLLAKEPQAERQAVHAQIESQYLQGLTGYGPRRLFILLLLPAIILLILYANIGYPYWPAEISQGYQFTSVSLLCFILLSVFVKLLVDLNRKITRNSEIENTLYGSPSTVFKAPSHSPLNRLLAWLLTTMVAPIQEFFARNGSKLAISILLFIFLFKLGEAYLGRMSIVFYREVGFSNTDIAYYSKLINWGVTIVFSLIGSIFTIRYGILKGLFIGGIAMSASNLLFALMAVVGPNKALFAFTVLIDGFTSAWGSVAFVALLSVLCNKSFTASQYALMASLGTFGRVMLGSYSGVLVDWLDGNWALFFILTSVMVVPSLLFLYAIRKPINRLIQSSELKH